MARRVPVRTADAALHPEGGIRGCGPRRTATLNRLVTAGRVVVVCAALT